jgi:hypothetical protein
MHITACSGFRDKATLVELVVICYGCEKLTQKVHLYGRLPRKMSNSKPSVITVSQLGLLRAYISTQSLGLSTNGHEDTSEGMI